eukprot:SAG22_NODE_959_length_6298_cov_3.186159_2_plen_189_part_00
MVAKASESQAQLAQLRRQLAKKDGELKQLRSELAKKEEELKQAASKASRVRETNAQKARLASERIAAAENRTATVEATAALAAAARPPSATTPSVQSTLPETAVSGATELDDQQLWAELPQVARVALAKEGYTSVADLREATPDDADIRSLTYADSDTPLKMKDRNTIKHFMRRLSALPLATAKVEPI